MELTQKGEMVSRLQAKAGQIGKILNNLEKYNHLLKDDKKLHDKRLEKRPCTKVDNKENIPKIPIVESSKDTNKESAKECSKSSNAPKDKSVNKTNDSKDPSKSEDLVDEARLSSDSTDSFVKLDLEPEEKSNA